MSYEDVAFAVAVFAFPLGLIVGFIAGGRQEAGYWISNSGCGWAYRRGGLYRVTRERGAPL